MDYSLFIIQLINGLQLGILLFLLASGLTLIFGIMDFVNLAHGSLYMVGALLCATFAELTGSFVLAAILALPATFLVGAALERVLIRHLYRRDHLDHVLATFGLILCFDSVAQIIWGASGMSIALPAWLNGRVILPAGIEMLPAGIEMLPAGIEVPSYRLAIIAVGLAVAAGLYLLVSHTRTGMLIRAGASNRAMVSALGVNVQLLFTGIFALGATLAGLAGIMIAPITGANIGMGNDIIIIAFVVIIIGGIGSVKGAFIAALLIGLIDTLGRSFLDDLLKFVISAQSAETAAPAISAMLVYVLMAAVLAFKPQGLFPPKGR